ncbi:hypothetical protein FSP39_025164 [Pinctada imbricata]|uniref:Small ribosomal subunit protein mS26 n=1 Tax=Pinctada imbricata TaxID=66713 RepID=A0AA89BUD0_PINIB|nr:hypothetical protein FSP39_025164 [Pinctada imbricata]
MTSLAKAFQQTSIHVCKINRCTPALIFVRWRKPRFVPRGKTKEFVLSDRPERNPEEEAFMNTKMNNYRTDLKSIIKYLKDLKQTTATTIQDEERKYQEEWESLQQKNQIWNERVQALREEGMKKEIEEKRARIDKLIQKDLEDMNKYMKFGESLIAQEKGFITPENVDEELEKVLDTKVDYEFAIDKTGRRYMDITTLPSENKEEIDSNG